MFWWVVTSQTHRVLLLNSVSYIYKTVVLLFKCLGLVSSHALKKKTRIGTCLLHGFAYLAASLLHIQIILV